jgi:ATP-dependent protease ClpP protease subunit
MPTEEIRAQINSTGVSDFEGVAVDGEGVFETLKSVSKIVVTNLS